MRFHPKIRTRFTIKCARLCSIRYNRLVKEIEKSTISELGLHKRSEIEISDQTLNIIDYLEKRPKIIVSKSMPYPLYIDGLFNAIFEEFELEGVLSLIRKMHFSDRMDKFELVFTHGDKKILYEFECFKVKYHHQDASMIFGVDHSHHQKNKSLDEKIIQLSDSILKINNSIDIRDQVAKTLDLVLVEAQKVLEKGTFGSIFLVQNDQFKIISYFGFSKEIEDFILPIADSFLYIATKGKMDKITLIDNIPDKYRVIPLRTSSGEYANLLTSIVAPLYNQGQLYGMMSIDSKYPDAFNENDLELIRIIRDNVQVIISNQLFFLEKSNQALTDQMTGLYNRYYLMEQFGSLLERSKRYQEKFCVVVFDIDNLKEVNDLYGHLAGDQIIKSFALSLQSTSRRSDIIARFGGDEFVAIYLMTDLEEIQKKLESINSSLMFKIGDKTLNLIFSFSYGISSFPRDGSSYVELINYADERMYQKKLLNKQKVTKDG